MAIISYHISHIYIFCAFPRSRLFHILELACGTHAVLLVLLVLLCSGFELNPFYAYWTDRFSFDCVLYQYMRRLIQLLQTNPAVKSAVKSVSGSFILHYLFVLFSISLSLCVYLHFFVGSVCGTCSFWLIIYWFFKRSKRARVALRLPTRSGATTVASILTSTLAWARPSTRIVRTATAALAALVVTVVARSPIVRRPVRRCAASGWNERST